MSKKRVYVDGMSTISLANGLVRMNFFNSEIVDGKNVTDINTEMIMPPQQFLQAFGAMEDLINKLINDGVISRKGAAAPKAAPAESDPGSPNFQ